MFTRIILALTLLLPVCSAAPPLSPAPVEPARLYGSLEMAPSHFAIGRKAGLRVAAVAVIWARFEPRPGAYDEKYIKALADQKDQLRKMDYQLQVDFGVQYPPAWVYEIPQGRYMDQFRDVFVSTRPGADLPNVVFNAEVRKQVSAYFGQVFTRLGNDWDFDIWIFRDSLSLDQSIEFLKAGIRGLNETDEQLKVGINITLFPSLPGEGDGNTELHEGVSIATAIDRDAELKLAYAGFDSYPGTWRDGGAESRDQYRDDFHEWTGKPIIIQEFGYSSAGDVMSESESSSGVYPCKARKWRFSWAGRAHDGDSGGVHRGVFRDICGQAVRDRGHLLSLD